MIQMWIILAYQYHRLVSWLSQLYCFLGELLIHMSTGGFFLSQKQLLSSHASIHHRPYTITIMIMVNGTLIVTCNHIIKSSRLTTALVLELVQWKILVNHVAVFPVFIVFVEWIAYS